MTIRIPLTRPMVFCLAAAGLSACTNTGDWDMRNPSDGFSTAPAAQRAVANRPQPDARGIISYPGYQVAIARDGDTVNSVAQRIGMNPGELARYNGVTPNAALRAGEVLALPTKVAEPTPATGAAPGTTVGGSGAINITTLAGNAINRAQNQQGGTQAPANTPVIQKGTQPIRHKVQPGETAYSVARLYNVPVKSLADWNGLDANLDVHVGQVLLIPPSRPAATGNAAAAGAAGAATAAASAAPATSVTPPGRQTPVSQPPSASKPLPTTTPPAAASAGPKLPPAPDLGKDRTSASSSKFAMPVSGTIVLPYNAAKNHKRIDFQAKPGSPVYAATSGTIRLVSTGVSKIPTVAIGQGDLLIVYANVDGIKVKKGESVKRGQVIGTVPAANNGVVGFAVAKGFDSVDPMPYLQ